MESFKQHLYSEAAENLTDTFEQGSFEAVGKKVLEAANVSPAFNLEQKDPVAFAESRSRLNSEAGLVIANHPGYYDTFAIFSALTRKDVKIIVSQENYESYAPILGEEHLIKASSEPSEALSLVRSVKEHIEHGGLVVLYPTGGVDRADKENKSFAFENGFSVMVRTCLKPTDMVYSFQFDDSEFEALLDEKIPRMVGAISAVAIDPALNINKLKNEAGIHVNERYSTAEEWKTIADSSDKDKRNQALAEHFLENFNQ